MSRWRSTLDSACVYSGMEREGSVARSAAGRAGSDHQPCAVRSLQRTCSAGKDCLSRRYGPSQAAVPATAPLFGSWRSKLMALWRVSLRLRASARGIVRSGKVLVFRLLGFFMLVSEARCFFYLSSGRKEAFLYRYKTKGTDLCSMAERHE